MTYIRIRRVFAGLASTILLGAALSAQATTVEVTTWDAVKSNLIAGNAVKLASDIAIGTAADQALYLDSSSSPALTMDLDLNGHKIDGYSGSATGSEKDRLFVLRKSGLTLTIRDTAGDGQIVGHTQITGHDGGFAFIDSGNKIVLESGTLTGFSTANAGGCIRVAGNGTLVMNGGTITNCTSTGSGGAIASWGTLTINGGTVVGCKQTSTKEGGGGAIRVDGGTAKIYGGSFLNNEGRNGGAISTASAVYIYGGYFAGNKARNDMHFLDGDGTGKYGYLYGGVWEDYNPSIDDPDAKSCDCNLMDGATVTQVGTKYIVGKSVAYDANALTGGTYTFNPTNAEYVAGGLTVAPWVDMTKDEAVDPKTWTLADNTTATDVGESAKARMKDGVCWITGSGVTSDAKPLDLQWASVKEVRITDGVTGIGTYFFDRFYNLTNVTVASSCKTLGEGAFYRCFGLEQITFEGEMPTIGDNALVVTAGIKMEDDKPVVYAVPNVTVNGASMTLKGSNDLQNWEDVTSGSEGDYHFFKFVAE